MPFGVVARNWIDCPFSYDREGAMEFFHKVSAFPFMHTRRMWYAVSAVAVIASLVLLVVRPLNFGIDFTGGVAQEFSFAQTADLEKVRKALEDAGVVDPQVQRVDSPRDVIVRLKGEQNLEAVSTRLNA